MSVGLNDYLNGEGFLEAGPAELQKAMVAGQITGRDTTNQYLTGEPLKIESLETSLRLLEFRQQDVRLWNAMPKMVAHNTVEEYLQLQSYGSQRGGFYGEGEDAENEDSVYIRRAEHVKYMQVKGKVTLQSQLVRSWIDTYQKEIDNKMMWITRLANRSLVHADSSIIPHEFNSLYKQHASIGLEQGFLYPTFEDYYNSGVVIDMRGKTLTQYDVEDAAVAIDANFGSVDSLFSTTQVISGLMKDYFETNRIVQNGTGFSGNIGNVVKGISTSMGDVTLNSDKFMNADPARRLSDPATSSKAPSAPVADVTTPAAVVADGKAKFADGETGNVFYAVAALNSFGESNITVLGAAAVTLAKGSAVDLKFTAGVGANATNGYVIYRTRPTTASVATNEVFFPIFKVSAANLVNGFDGAASGKIRDRGYFLPDTEQGFMTAMVEDVLSFKQLAPMSKLDLAVNDPSKSFIVFLYGTPILYTPKKFVRFINIGRTYKRA